MNGAIIPPNQTLKKASSASDAISNATSEIIVVAKGTATSVSAALTLTIPVLALESSSRYFMVSDSYNTATVYHLQVVANKTAIVEARFYYGASEISGATIEYYYR